MSGITRYGSYVPFFRLQRKAIGPAAGRGERAVASYDEDAVSLAIEASREALHDPTPLDQIVFATTSPPYAEKLNATMLQAALGLPEQVGSVELGSCSRMGLAALALGADLATAGRRTLVAAADLVVGAPGGARESQGGDAGVAFVTGPDDEALARFVGRASSTTELLDIWRLPEDRFASQWEERFGAEVLGPVVIEAATRALVDAKCEPTDVTTLVLDAANPRAARGVPGALRLKPEQLGDPLGGSVGRAGVAQAGLQLAHALDAASPGDRILVISLADGCDALVLEVTDKIKAGRPKHSVDDWIASKRDDLPYNTYLKWRGVLPFEPPRRPDPERPGAPPMRRNEGWKLGFEGSRCRSCGTGHLPPQRVCVSCSAIDEMNAERFADATCRIATYTLDHLAYSLQPPVVVGVLDFEGGGRLTCELTDVDPAQVTIGDELEMTFRRLYTGQGVHNYFWKARPRR